MAAKQVPVDPSAQMDIDQVDGVYEFATDLAYQRLMIVNVAYCGVPNAQDRQWVLLDTGVMEVPARSKKQQHAVSAKDHDLPPLS